MRRAIFGALSLVVCYSFASAASETDSQAREAALQWLAMIDAGQYTKAYHAVVPRLRNSGSEEQWNRWLRFHRAPLGRAQARQFLRVQHTHTALGLPDGNYMEIGFKTSFEHKAVGAEWVRLSSEAGRWQVCNYRIY
jgi:hypothetical protein